MIYFIFTESMFLYILYIMKDNTNKKEDLSVHDAKECISCGYVCYLNENNLCRPCVKSGNTGSDYAELPIFNQW